MQVSYNIHSFLFGNEYLRAHGAPGLVDPRQMRNGSVEDVAVASGQLDANGLLL